MENMTSSFPATNRQTKKTCVQCRQRKVKCVSRTPGVTPCDNCRRLRFNCVFRDGRVPAGAQDELPRPELRRASKACNRCREHKIRCTGVLPCAGCLKRSIICEYPGSPPPAPAPVSASVSGRKRGRGSGPRPGSATASVSSHDVAMTMDDDDDYDVYENAQRITSIFGTAYTEQDIGHLIDAFFQHVYPLPSYSFLHPAQTRRKFRRGTLDDALLTAIAAVSSLRCPGGGGMGTTQLREREESWIAESEGLIWEHLESPSVARLQATLLVVLYRVETGQLRRAFMLAALAGRAAAAMRLNHERPALAAVAAAASTSSSSSRSVFKALEVRRRLMWSLKMVERYFSVGLPEFELCPVENIYIQLPCTEPLFSGRSSTGYTIDNDENVDDEAQEIDDGGAYHLCVNLEMFRRDVMKLHRSLALYDQPFPQLPRLIQDFQRHLDEIGTRFPQEAINSGAGEGTVRSRGRWLPRHLLMRLSWHQCHCDLYRLLLRNFRDAAPSVVIDALDTDFLNAAEALCIHHAQAIVQEIASLADEERLRTAPCDEPRLLEFDSAICAYTASRILLFTARFGLTPSRPSEMFSLSRAEACLAAIRYFFPRSPLVKPIISELTRLMDVFNNGTGASPWHFASPNLSATTAAVLTSGRGGSVTRGLDEDEGSRRRDPAAQLSGAARIRQRLAVHSLLRQAGFSDDDYDYDDDDDLEGGEDDGGVGGTMLPYPTMGASYMSPSTATTTSTGAGSHTTTGMDQPVFEPTGSPYTAQQSLPQRQSHQLYQPQQQQYRQHQGGMTMGDFSTGNNISPTMAHANNPDPSWPHRYFSGGDLVQSGPEAQSQMQGEKMVEEAKDRDEEGPTGALNQRSFSFPWLQREDADQWWFML